MSNSTWLCFDCRVAVRRPTTHEADVPCPRCGGACRGIGQKIPVPPRRDERAWGTLRDSLDARDDEAMRARQVERVRARHALEREIRRLEGMPASPGRARAIRALRRRLDAG